MMKYSLQPIMFFLVLILAASCSNKRERQQQQEDMYFEVNEELLGEQQKNKELGITYAPPANWNKVVGEARENLGKTLEEMGATKDVKLVDVYFEPASRSLLFISDISTLPDSAIAFAIANHKNYFSTGNEQEQILTDSFTYDGFRVRQFLIQNPAIINFKLWYLLGAKRRFQVDFMVPSQAYAEKVKEIESAIGSIHQLN